ncbi:hypothetical protein Purlil1_12461 [Purpureocillium lilacinum]|uniref:G domain-containing protein n=1 Tax=Purpureocillium lilacinum TaxID=33203 RepID=A0ABR0BHB3_PURLI|nr:hypothetical protein Purlil1_12461 [Purpureocillium lilacinum]
MFACFEPLAYSISVVLSWLSRRVVSRRLSCLIIGELGVGKTSLINILMNEEPDAQYMPTVGVQRHDPPGRGYSLIEAPGSLPDAEIQRIKTASDYDLIIFLFRPDKISTAHYYRRFWTTPPSVPWRAALMLDRRGNVRSAGEDHRWYIPHQIKRQHHRAHFHAVGGANDNRLQAKWAVKSGGRAGCSNLCSHPWRPESREKRGRLCLKSLVPDTYSTDSLPVVHPEPFLILYLFLQGLVAPTEVPDSLVVIALPFFQAPDFFCERIDPVSDPLPGHLLVYAVLGSLAL